MLRSRTIQKWRPILTKKNCFTIEKVCINYADLTCGTVVRKRFLGRLQALLPLLHIDWDTMAIQNFNQAPKRCPHPTVG